MAKRAFREYMGDLKRLMKPGQVVIWQWDPFEDRWHGAIVEPCCNGQYSTLVESEGESGAAALSGLIDQMGKKG